MCRLHSKHGRVLIAFSVPFAQPHTRTAAAILIDKLDASLLQNALHQFERFWVTRVTADLYIRDGIAVKACRFGKVSDGPIQGRASHPQLCTCHRHCIVLMSHVLLS
jgi:hypothetical protein